MVSDNVHGLNIADSNPLIQDNTIQFNPGYGIYLASV